MAPQRSAQGLASIARKAFAGIQAASKSLGAALSGTPKVLVAAETVHFVGSAVWNSNCEVRAAACESLQITQAWGFADAYALGGMHIPFADGHTALNTPDLFRPPKLSSAGPG